MDILNLLERIEDIIEDSSKFPLSNKVMIDKEEVLEVINEIRLKLPDEINRASWVAKERQRILNEAQSEADELINKVKEQQKHLIEESEICLLYTSGNKQSFRKHNYISCKCGS